MNVYKCISEELTGYYSLGEGLEVPEPYRIAELVAAPTRARAKLLAWKTDGFRYSYSMWDMPKFEIKMVRKGEDIPEGIVSNIAWWWIEEPQAWKISEADLVYRWLGEAYEMEYEEWCPRW